MELLMGGIKQKKKKKEKDLIFLYTPSRAKRVDFAVLSAQWCQALRTLGNIE